MTTLNRAVQWICPAGELMGCRTLFAWVTPDGQGKPATPIGGPPIWVVCHVTVKDKVDFVSEYAILIGCVE